MAQITLNQPIAEIHGALSKRSNIVNRQKKYRINGRVIHEGKQESYAIQNPRDFKKSPKTGAELANHNLWSEACRRTAQILQAAQPDGPTEQQLFERRISQIPDYYTLEEARMLLEDFRRRYEAQLPTPVASTQTHKHPLIQRLAKANNTPNSQPSFAPCSTTNYELNNQLRPLFFVIVCSFSQISFGYFSYYPATCLALAVAGSPKNLDFWGAFSPARKYLTFIPPKTFSTQNLQIRKFCCTFAPAFSFREAGEILAQTRCCDLQYRLFRI